MRVLTYYHSSLGWIEIFDIPVHQERTKFHRHRVIGANGSLTGYAGGIERKKWLLEHKAKNLKPETLIYD